MTNTQNNTNETAKKTAPKKGKWDAQKGKITNLEDLKRAEKLTRKFPASEFIPFAKNTPWEEIATTIQPDKNGAWVTPIIVTTSRHVTTIGVENLIRKASEFLLHYNEHPDYEIEILSITAGVDDNKLALTTLFRSYKKDIHIKQIFRYLGEDQLQNSSGDSSKKSKFLIPESAYRPISKQEREIHENILQLQKNALAQATPEKPFLNQLDSYTLSKLTEVDPRVEMEYDLRTKDMEIQLNTSYDNFIKIFQEIMVYITANKRDNYYAVLQGKDEESSFFNVIDAHIKKHYIGKQLLPAEDMPALMAKLRRALFDLYIVQDLIDDTMITDVKITDPKSIRVRVKGKAYLSNITFIDTDDYIRFIQGIAVANNIDLGVPSQTFTDEQDDNYILRFSLTSPYTTSTGFPIIHIRKIPRK